MIDSKRCFKTSAIATVAVTACYGVSAGTIVNVDLTGVSNEGAVANDLPGLVGDSVFAKWNAVSSNAEVTNLLDEDGVATTVSFDIDDATTNTFSGGGGVNDFFRGYTFLQGGPGVSTPDQGAFTIGGLDNAKTYNIVFYATWDFIDAGSEFSLDGGTTWKLSDGVPSVSNAAFIEGQSYVLFTDVAPTAGEIDGLWRTTLEGDSTAHRGPFNGFQIQEVPEPGSLALLTAGALCTLRRRRD
ncbi:MAG: PEP-CTERM sorting domain-containing protein [Planctomycetota bacterium]